ncbi:MAG TPA: hypothetical protein VFO76_06960 [Candidatus Kapabacteria bacterium]|nr:hypothetical protein [Candidatus Kapabacteria bacterium]
MSESKPTAELQELTTIKSLLAQILIKGMTQAESIIQLNKAGLAPKEIASILNTTSNVVNVTLTRSRKK